jgi:hypothetical protein
VNVIEYDGRSLEAFETAFTYPLGEGGRFRISHGDDYGRFYRSMGEARCFLLEDRGRILGSIGVAIRRLRTPQGPEISAAYLGDLRVLPESRGGRALLRLARAAGEWARPRASVGFAIVMEGTDATPADYTGRAGLPAFREVGRLSLFRIPGEARESTPGDGAALFEELTRGRTVVRSGDPAMRSLHPVRWLVARDRAACGRLEDTMRAKRLFLADGTELRAAHLACFAYRTPEAGEDLALQAAGEAARAGFPAIWVPVPAEDASEFRRRFAAVPVLESAAVVYGTGSPSSSWCVQTSEI